MKPDTLPARIRFALPFTILTQPDLVRLVAGEDFRYTLRAPALEQWLPQWLGRFERAVEWRSALEELSPERRKEALEIIERLYGERALQEGIGERINIPRALGWKVEGMGKLSERLRLAVPVAAGNAAPCAAFCQDNLDYAAALDFNRRCRESGAFAWIWISSGPMGRGYVSPIFRADGGPCLGCLIRNFERLSPAPEIYRHLIEHAGAGGAIPAVPFPERAIELLATLARWKMEAAAPAEPSRGVYRLQVVEIDSMAVTTHAVFRDPHCPDCCRK